MREALTFGVADRALAFENAVIATDLQVCVRDLIAQRVRP